MPTEDAARSDAPSDVSRDSRSTPVVRRRRRRSVGTPHTSRRTSRRPTDRSRDQPSGNDPRTPAERRPWLHDSRPSAERSRRGVDPPSPALVGLPVVALAVAAVAQLLAGILAGVQPTATLTTAGYVTAAVGYATSLVSGAYALVRAGLWVRR